MLDSGVPYPCPVPLTFAEFFFIIHLLSESQPAPITPPPPPPEVQPVTTLSPLSPVSLLSFHPFASFRGRNNPQSNVRLYRRMQLVRLGYICHRENALDKTIQGGQGTLLIGLRHSVSNTDGNSLTRDILAGHSEFKIYFQYSTRKQNVRYGTVHISVQMLQEILF